MDDELELQQKQYKKMTTEPVGKLLFTLSVPTIISMMVTNIYNLVDTAFVGTLGTSESGATGIVFSYMAILQAVAFMCGQGAGSTVFYLQSDDEQSAPLRGKGKAWNHRTHDRCAYQHWSRYGADLWV